MMRDSYGTFAADKWDTHTDGRLMMTLASPKKLDRKASFFSTLPLLIGNELVIQGKLFFNEPLVSLLIGHISLGSAEPCRSSLIFTVQSIQCIRLPCQVFILFSLLFL